MIRQLNRYELDFNRASFYVNDRLKNANSLSDTLFNMIDFKNGNFFTLLLDNSNLDRLYEFKDGIILPQNPEIEYFPKGVRNTYTVIPTMYDEIACFLLEKVKKNDELAYVIDDVSSLPSEIKDEKDCEVFYGKEVYCLVEKKKATVECLIKCLRQSQAFWHSLCVLTKLSVFPSEEFIPK